MEAFPSCRRPWREAPAGTQRPAEISSMNATPRKQQPASYEQACTELEQLVQQLESGQMSLDDTLKAYARGSQLLRYCREQLQAVEQQVQILDGDELKPLADERERDDD